MTEAAPAGTAAGDETPLWPRLGIRPGCVLALVGTPDGFALPGLPEGVRVLERASEPIDVTLFFTSREKTLRGRMALLAPWIAPAGALWIAWPNPGSGHETDLSVDVIQAVGAEAGLEGDEVSSIDETWTALRLVRQAVDG